MTSNTSSIIFAGGDPSGLVFKGTWDASVATFPAAANTGFLYKISVAGTIDGVLFSVGDSLYATADAASTTTFAGNWAKVSAVDAVTTVHGRVGAVVAVEADYDLGELGDVDTTTTPPATSDIFRYNGVNWTPGTEGSFGLFADNTTVAPVTPGAPTSAEIVTFVGAQRDKFVFYTGTNTSTDPSTYIWYVDRAGSLIQLKGPGSAVAALNDLTDVDTTTVPPVNGNTLVYNTGVWAPGSGSSAYAGEVPTVVARLALSNNPGQTVYQQDTRKAYLQLRAPVTSNANWIEIGAITNDFEFSGTVSTFDSSAFTWDVTG